MSTIQKCSVTKEGKNHRKLDAMDRSKISDSLKKYTSSRTTMRDARSNINGRGAPDEMDVDRSLAIGGKTAAEFMTKHPLVSTSPLKKTLEAMKRKKVKLGDTNVQDMEKLYARLLVVSQKRDIELHELSHAFVIV